MPFQKGKKKTGGRVKGTPNKATENAREAIARFVDSNSVKFDAWLDEIYEEHGAKEAFECVRSLIEYHVPKQSRIESNVTVNNQEEFVNEEAAFINEYNKTKQDDTVD